MVGWLVFRHREREREREQKISVVLTSYGWGNFICDPGAAHQVRVGLWAHSKDHGSGLEGGHMYNAHSSSHEDR